MTTIASEDMHRSWGATLDRVFKGEQLVVERFGRPMAVLVNVEQWASLTAQIEDLQARRVDEEFAGRTLTDQEWALLKEARSALTLGGTTISSEELKAKLKERYPHAAHKI